jgi:hypothetical protein
MERNLTSERTTAALSKKKISGRVYTHITPLGFDGEGDLLKENTDEMATVWHIQQLKAEGMGLRRIAGMRRLR